jgi:hypothetical protein
MACRQSSLSRTLAVTMALALAASGVAIADDTSTSRFGGDGYAYFSQSVRGNTAAVWRQSHPNGLSQRDLQAASSSSLAASASQLDNANAVSAGTPADPSWRQTHPNGLTQSELQAASASSLATWQPASGASVGSAPGNAAQSSSGTTSLTRK